MTGLRKGELKNLKKKDLSLDKCTLFIRECKNDEPAYIPFPDTLYPILRELDKACRDDESPIFYFMNFEGHWERARLSAGLGDIRFHDLRHTFASHLIQNSNGNLKVVQELLRHKDIRLTQRYSHLSPGYLRQASLTLDKTFANLGATVPLLPQLPLGAAAVANPDALSLTKV